MAEFQVFACIPPDVSVPMKDLADLTGIPEQQLARVIRLTATYGLLREPKPGFVTHTPLSAQFTAEQPLLDAVVFMAESVAPAALQMALATQRFGSTRNPTESAYNLAMNTVRPFHVARQESPKLDRQWSAYLRHGGGLQQEDTLVEALSRLNWANLGNACIVEVSKVKPAASSPQPGLSPYLPPSIGPAIQYMAVPLLLVQPPSTSPSHTSFPQTCPLRSCHTTH